MKRLPIMIIIVVTIITIAFTFSTTGCKEQVAETTTTTVVQVETTAAETTKAEEITTTVEEWTPYYKTADFKSYVDVKPESLYKPDDEMKVKPVDRIPEESVRIGVLGGQTNPFFDAVYDGVDAAKMELAKHNTVVDWIIPGATFGSGDYGEAINTLVTKGYPAISTMILNDGMVPFVDNAVDQGVVIGSWCVNSQKPNKALFYIGQDLYKAGGVAAEALAKEIGGKGKVAIVTGFYSVYGHEQRRLGFVDTIKAKYPDIEIVGEVENLDQADKALSAVTDFITAHPDLAAVYETAGGPTGGIEAVKQAGKTGQIKVVCFYVPELAPYLESGECAAAIAQNAFAEGHDTIVRLFNYLMDGILPPAKNMWTEMFVVTPENLQEFLDSGQGA